MPRCFSTSIQSDVAWRELLRDLTVPASWMAPPNSSSFSVSVVLPASGCEMMPNVRRVATSRMRSAGKAAVSKAKPPGDEGPAARELYKENRMLGRIAAIAMLAAAPLARAEEVGCTSTTFRLFGANDRICVYAFDDPRVPGVTCHISQARTG